MRLTKPVKRLSHSEVTSLRSEMLEAEKRLADMAANSPKVQELKSRLNRNHRGMQ